MVFDCDLLRPKLYRGNKTHAASGVVHILRDLCRRQGRSAADDQEGEQNKAPPDHALPEPQEEVLGLHFVEPQPLLVALHDLGDVCDRPRDGEMPKSPQLVPEGPTAGGALLLVERAGGGEGGGLYVGGGLLEFVVIVVGVGVTLAARVAVGGHDNLLPSKLVQDGLGDDQEGAKQTCLDADNGHIDPPEHDECDGNGEQELAETAEEEGESDHELALLCAALHSAAQAHDDRKGDLRRVFQEEGGVEGALKGVLVGRHQRLIVRGAGQVSCMSGKVET
mmetsp:Transcript_46158/g.100045  ORF Transcript_46158/g.100045 Transcript_46158/m.100045 type:complete len:279 (-) Transcript_46158:842-1678(-)